MRVALDATPLLGRLTGIGTYVDRLVRALSELDDPPDLTLAPFTIRGASALTAPPAGTAPYHARVVHRPMSARLLQSLWARTNVPPVEWLSGRCDVFHATNYVLPPTRRAARVVTVQDLTFVRFPATVTPAVLRFQQLVPRSIARADVVLCPAESTADDVAEHYGLSRDTVLVTPLGVDPAWARTERPSTAWLAEHGMPDRYVLFVGSQEPRKGLDTLIAAHSAARAGNRDGVPTLVLAGPPGWGKPVDAPDAIRTGYLTDAELRSLVAGASCLVLPSVYEGFGLPLLEAMACGRPVIASDLPVHREVTGGHALLFPVGDVDALAAALTTASAEDGTPGAKERAGMRRRWAAGWTWKRCAEQTNAAYGIALALHR